MSLLQWSHVFSDMVSSRAPSSSSTTLSPLQWSHVFSDMVRLDTGQQQLVAMSASMEPCLFRHGKQSELPALQTRRPGFNGAMSFQTW